MRPLINPSAISVRRSVLCLLLLVKPPSRTKPTNNDIFFVTVPMMTPAYAVEAAPPCRRSARSKCKRWVKSLRDEICCAGEIRLGGGLVDLISSEDEVRRFHPRARPRISPRRKPRSHSRSVMNEYARTLNPIYQTVKSYPRG